MKTVSILLILSAPIPATLVADDTKSFAVAAAPDPAQQMREHLESLDRRLRLRLLRIADQGSSDGPVATVPEEEIDRFHRHLRSLEDRLHAWPKESDAESLIRKVRALRPLVDNLGRAAKRPETAASDLASFRKALRVEWPPYSLSSGRTGPGSKGGLVNDDCTEALPIGDGTYFGDTTTATPDGEGCYGPSGSPDVWFAYTSPETADTVADTFGSGFDTELSVHTDCPGTYDNQIACNDDTFGLQSAVSFQAQAGVEYLIRVAGSYDGASGPFTLNVGPGGVISGVVTEAVSGAPIAGVELIATTTDGYNAGSTVSDPNGDYAIPGLPTGTYFIHTSYAAGYLREIYDDLPCSYEYGCEPDTGTPITVTSGATTGGIDFALHRGGMISGTVTQTTTGGPIANVTIRVWDNHGNQVSSDYADAAGSYSIAELYAGSYTVTAESSEYLSELYDDIACLGGGYGGCDPTTGTPIDVTFDTVTGGVDFALERLAVITGTVTESATGFPMSSADIVVWDETGEVAYAYTDSTGFYQVGGLNAGTYYVTTRTYDHFDEVFDGLPCELNCDATTGTPIAVSLNSTTPGIDFELERLGAISGTVAQTQTSTPIDDARVEIRDVLGDRIDWTYTNSAGNYVTEGLSPGNHTAIAEHDHYLDELFDDIPCEDGDCDPAGGTPIAVALNAVTGGVDFELERLGSISGRVTNAQTGEPVYDAFLLVYDSGGDFQQSAFTDSAGIYTVHGLTPGSHFAIASYYDLDDVLYDGIPCEDGCDPTTGTSIPASLATTTTGIDFALSRCAPTDTSLCLTGSRFRVEADWENFQNVVAPAFAQTLTADTGFFYFQNPNNIELVIKVLDACFAPYNHFWVFAAGLTNTGIELTVTDEVTGDRQTYTNPLGNPFPPLQDTMAFATCGATPLTAGPSAIETATAGTAPSSLESWSSIPAGAEKGACAPSTTGMCLNGGRFLVEAFWNPPVGPGGVAIAVPLTDESGYFWFGGPDNVEVVVKILNACSLDPFNSYWVFAAGLTNLEVALRVTDTETDEIREYFNPLGMAFQPILDTRAFPTCP